MRKSARRHTHAGFRSIDAAELAKVSGGVLWEPGLDIMGGCFPTEPVPSLPPAQLRGPAVKGS